MAVHPLMNWTIWRPDVLFLLVLLSVLYWIVTRQVHPHASCEEICNTLFYSLRSSDAQFCMGLFVLYLIMGPLAVFAEQYSFTVYVLQMLLGTMVLPRLLVFSLPKCVFQQIMQISWIRQLITLFTKPLIAMVIFNGLVTATFIPSVLNRLLTINWLHAMTENSIFLAAIFFWWPIFHPLSAAQELTRGQKILYIVYSTNFMMPIIVLLVISNHPWYQVFVLGSQTIGINALADQQRGGVLMLMAMYLVYGTLAAVNYIRQDQSVWYE